MGKYDILHGLWANHFLVDMLLQLFKLQTWQHSGYTEQAIPAHLIYFSKSYACSTKVSSSEPIKELR